MVALEQYRVAVLAVAVVVLLALGALAGGGVAYWLTSRHYRPVVAELQEGTKASASTLASCRTTASTLEGQVGQQNRRWRISGATLTTAPPRPRPTSSRQSRRPATATRGRTATSRSAPAATRPRRLHPSSIRRWASDLAGVFEMRRRISSSTLALALCIAVLAGCAARPPIDHEPRVVRAEVPVSVPCRVTIPLAPAWAIEGLRKGDDLETKVRALVAKREQRIGFEALLLAAVKSCQ